MNNLFQENRKMFFLLISLFLFLLVVLYIAFYRPLLEELKSKESLMKSVETEIAVAHLEIENIEEDAIIDTAVLRKKIPLARDLDKFLLSLQEIELISGSRIETIDFQYESNLPEVGVEEDTENEEGTNEPEKEIDHDSINTEVNGDETAHRVIAISGKPENLHSITVKLTVFSPTYKNFKQFITEIEKQERISIVSTLEFDKPAEKEIVFEESPDETIAFTIDITTFYYDE